MALQFKQAQVRPGLHKHLQPAGGMKSGSSQHHTLACLLKWCKAKICFKGKEQHVTSFMQAEQPMYGHIPHLQWSRRALQGLWQRALGQLWLWWQVLECCQEPLQ